MVLFLATKKRTLHAPDYKKVYFLTKKQDEEIFVLSDIQKVHTSGTAGSASFTTWMAVRTGPISPL